MSEVIHIIKRIDGRTVYCRAGRVMVRFDSEEDRERFEAAYRLLDCVQRQDIKAAAGVVFDAVNEGLDLLGYIDDDEVREIICHRRVRSGSRKAGQSMIQDARGRYRISTIFDVSPNMRAR